MKIYDYRQKITNINIRVLLTMALLMTIFTMGEQHELVSFTFTLTFFGLITFLFADLTFNEIKKSEYKLMILLIMILTISFIAAIRDSSSFEDIKKYIMFVSTLIYIFISQRIKVNRKTVHIILSTNILLAVAYIVLGLIMRAGYSDIYKALTLNFQNPNAAGMWIFHAILYLTIAMFFYKSKAKRFMLFMALVALAYLMFLTKSRAVLVASVSFLFLFVFVFMKKKPRINRWMIIVMLTLPLVFALIYLGIMNSDILARSDLFDFAASGGKTLDSRKSIWLYGIRIINDYPLLGKYIQVEYQLHNIHIDTLASYGIMVFVLFMIYIIQITLKISKECFTKVQSLSMVAFLSVIALGTFEAILLSGGLGIYLLSVSFLIIARYRPDKS